MSLKPFTKDAIRFIKSIPRGKVVSYGDTAACCGNPGAARQVARILHACSEKYQLPWHRVVSQKLKISLKGDSSDHQKQLLISEGVLFGSDNNIGEKQRWLP